MGTQKEESGNETVIDMLATGKSLRPIIYIIKMAVVMMLNEGRTCLMHKDLLSAKQHFHNENKGNIQTI